MVRVEKRKISNRPQHDQRQERNSGQSRGGGGGAGGVPVPAHAGQRRQRGSSPRRGEDHGSAYRGDGNKKVRHHMDLSSSSSRTKKQISTMAEHDEHIASEDEDEVFDFDNDEDQEDNRSDHDEDDDEDDEPLDVKKVRLARQYLEKLDKKKRSSDTSSSSSSDDEEKEEEGIRDRDHGHHDMVGRKLQRDRLKRQGTLERILADRLSQRIQLLYNNINARTSFQEKQQQEPKSAPAPSQAQQQSSWIDAGYIQLLKGHDLTPTCTALEPTGQFAVSGSKDHSVILWDIEHGCRVSYICPQWKNQVASSSSSVHHRTMGQVLSIAISDDGRYTAVGSKDGLVRIFDIRTNPGNNNSSSTTTTTSTTHNINLVKTFVGHKAAITALTFRTQSLQLFSGSEDRCIKQYNLDDMVHMETLYGHQFGITGIDCFQRERPISIGRDHTARAWKIADDTHLIFRGGSKLYSAESIAMIKDDWFLTGHEDGHFALWFTERKRAVSLVENAHGVIHTTSPTTTMNGTTTTTTNVSSPSLGYPIISVAALKASDVAATGSKNGYLQFWKVKTGDRHDDRGLEPLVFNNGNGGDDKNGSSGHGGRGSNSSLGIPLHGYINSIAIGPKAKFCIAAIGQEHRLGRWDRIPKAKNRLAIVKLYSTETNDDDHSNSSNDDCEQDDHDDNNNDNDDDDDGGDNDDDDDHVKTPKYLIDPE